ncbi:MAG: PepSY-like domain-containing protein [Tannerellaceae bacterium]|nr:PepSY-like domain-containing protein [Tannerellaceae bacterium]
MISRLLIGALLVCMAALAGCSDDDSDPNYTPTQIVENALYSKYPDARQVNWKLENGSPVAVFRMDSKTYEVWFETNGTWIATYMDISYADLPNAVITGMDNSDFKLWTVLSVRRTDRPSGIFYIFQLEESGGKRQVIFTMDGRLVSSQEKI